MFLDDILMGSNNSWESKIIYFLNGYKKEIIHEEAVFYFSGQYKVISKRKINKAVVFVNKLVFLEKIKLSSPQKL
jgi:hypothetical protein